MREETETDVDENSKPITNATAEEHVTSSLGTSRINSAQPSRSNAVTGKKRKYKEYSCSYCGKHFRHKGNMQQHVRTHTQERPFSCNVCGMSFKKSSALLEHRRRHKGISHVDNRDKFFDCEICNRSFLSKNSLTVHLRVHSDELSFSCKTCGKKFRHKSSLSRHSLIHTGDKKYSCDYCQRRFYDSSDMKKHLATHTGYKKYQCVHCRKRFIQSSSYRSHLKVHSSDKKPDKSDVKVCSENGLFGMSDSELFEDNSDIEMVGENSENESVDSVDEDEILHIARNLDKSCDNYATNKLGQLSCANIEKCSSDKPSEEECIKTSQQLQTSFRPNNKENATFRKGTSRKESKVSETTHVLRSKSVCVVKTEIIDDEMSGKPNEKKISQCGNSNNLIRRVSLNSREEDVINEHSKDSEASGTMTSASVCNFIDEIENDNEIKKHLCVSGSSDATKGKQAIVVNEVTNYPCVRNIEGLARNNLEDSITSPKLGKDEMGSITKSIVKENVEVIANDNTQAVSTSNASKYFNTEKNVVDASNSAHTDSVMQNRKFVLDKERSYCEAVVGSSITQDVFSNVFITCTAESNEVHENGSVDDRIVLVHVSVEEPAHIGPIENTLNLVGTRFHTPRSRSVHNNKQQDNSEISKQKRQETGNDSSDIETQSKGAQNNDSLEYSNEIKNTKPQSRENIQVKQDSDASMLHGWLFKARKAEKSKEKVKAKKCRHCEMFFEDNTLYLKHLKEHWKDKTFTCEDCLQAFVKWRDYSHHVCGKTKSRNTKVDYVCAYCNKRFKTKETWSKHVKVKRKPCNDCNRIFCSSKDLIRHCKTHLKKSTAFLYQSKHNTDSDEAFNAKFVSYDNVTSRNGCSEADIEPYLSRGTETDQLSSLSNKVDCHRLTTLEKEGCVSDSLSRSASQDKDVVFRDDHGSTDSKNENYKVTKKVNNKEKTVRTPTTYCDKGTSGSSDKLIISNKLFLKKNKMLTGKRRPSQKLEISYKGTGKFKDKLNELDVNKRGTDHDNEEDASETVFNMTKPNKTVNNKYELRMNETTQCSAFVTTENFSRKNQGSVQLYDFSISDETYFEKLDSSALQGQNLLTRTSNLECCDKQTEGVEQNQSSSDSESTSVEEDDGSYEEVGLSKDLKMEGHGVDNNETSDRHFFNSWNKRFGEKVTPKWLLCRPQSSLSGKNSTCSLNIERKYKSRSKSAQKNRHSLRNKGKAQGDSETKIVMVKTTDHCDSSDSASGEDSGESCDSVSDDDSEGYEECTAEEVQAMLSGL